VTVGADILPTPQQGVRRVRLEHSPHHARTCSGLNIHANTLYSASIRSTELLGLGWKAAARRLDIQLAGRIQGLLSRRT
jgi:hypothetical protein